MGNAFLVVIGLGLNPAGHLTIEAEAWLKQVDHLFYLPSPATPWLVHHYPQAKASTIQTLLGQILPLLKKEQRLCLAVMGHPASQAGLQMIIGQVREAGYEAWLTPAISAEDALFADLGLDPGRGGCQSFRATYFLFQQPRFDPRATLLLWHITPIGNLETRPGLTLLTEYLQNHYPADYPVTLYEVGPRPESHQGLLHQLPEANPTPHTLLCLRPSKFTIAD